MQALAYTQQDRILSDSTYKQVRFLTSGCCEDTGHVGESELQSLGLDFQSFDDGASYPLTEEEQNFIAEEYLDIDGNGLLCLMGYSALLNGRKYLVPAIEVSFDESVPNSMLTQQEAQELNQKARAIGARIAYITDGYYMWSDNPDIMFNDDHGRYVTDLFIPMDYAKSVAIGLDTWQAHLKGIVSAL